MAGKKGYQYIGCPAGSSDLRKPQHTLVSHTPGIPKPPIERNSFINRWLGVWGMFQGYVEKLLDRNMFSI